MLRFLSVLVLVVASAASQVIYSVPHKDGVMTLFADASVLYVQAGVEDGFQTSYSGGAGSMAARMQGQVSPPADGPVLTTVWTDARGVTHSVATPVPSQTPQGIQRAVDAHNTLVTTLQQIHPPRPNP